MTDPVPDVPLLRKVLEWAEAEAAKPDDECEWNQGMWRYVESGPGCGTAYCVAGYACHVMGEEWASPRADSELSGGRRVPDVAREHLGLDHNEADTLFAHENTIADVRREAESIAARAGERL